MINLPAILEANVGFVMVIVGLLLMVSSGGYANKRQSYDDIGLVLVVIGLVCLFLGV